MPSEQVGAIRVAMTIYGRFNRLYPVAWISSRYSGFLIILSVIYMHFGFNELGARPSFIVLWLGVYLGYLLFLELTRWKWVGKYDTWWFRFVRILMSLIFITILISISPRTQYIFGLFYLMPLLATSTYFFKPKWTSLVVFSVAIIGLYIATLPQIRQERFTLVHFSLISLTLALFTYLFRQGYKRALTQPDDLIQIAKELYKVSDIYEIAKEVVVICKRSSGADRAMIIIVDPDRHHYVAHANLGYELRDGFTIEDIAKKCFVLREGKRFEESDLVKAFKNKSLYSKFFQDCDPRSVFSEPIYCSDGRLLGVINITHKEPHRFDVIMQNKISRFGSLVGITLENSLSSREAQIGKAKESIASDLLSEATNEDQIVQILLGEVKRLVPIADGIVLHKFYPSTGELLPIATSHLGVLIPWKAIYDDPESKDPIKLGRSTMGIGIGIAGRALELRDSMRVPNVKNHPWFVKNVQVNPFESLLVAPLIDHDTGEALGTISVHSQMISAFCLKDEIALVSLSHQGSHALSKVRGFISWKEHGGVLKKIFDEIRLHDIGLEEKELYKKIVDSAINVLGFNMARIRILDPVTNELITAAVSGVPEPEAIKLRGQKIPLRILEPFLSKEFRAERSYLLPHDHPRWREVAHEYFYIPPEAHEKQTGWRAYDAFITPLNSLSGDLVGLLSLDCPKTGVLPDTPTIEAVGVFASVATWEIELARERQRLTEQQQRRDEYLESISDALNTSDDFNIIGEIIVHAGAKLLSAEGCSLYLIERDKLMLAHSNYLPINFIGRKKPIGTEKFGLTSYVADTGDTLRYNDKSFEAHSAWAGDKTHLKYLPSNDCHSLLIVPIKKRENQIVGVIKLENKLKFGRVAYFDDDDIKRLNSLANQVVLALEVTQRIPEKRMLGRIGLEDDLHEIINLYHSGVALWIETIFDWLKKGRIDKVEELFPELRHRAFTTVYELKSLHSAIRYKYLEDDNLSRALDLIKITWSERAAKKYSSPLPIIVNCPPNIEIQAQVRQALIRIASEALSNAVMHSGVLENPNVEILINVEDTWDQVVLQVLDNGRGAEQLKEGFGISKMRYIVKKLNDAGGKTEFDINTIPNKGTTVSVRVFKEIFLNKPPTT